MTHVDTFNWCSPLRVPRRHHLEQSNTLKTRLNQASKDHSPSGRDRICRSLPGCVYCLPSSNDPYFLIPHCLRSPHCQDNGQESPGTCSCPATEGHRICAAAGSAEWRQCGDVDPSGRFCEGKRRSLYSPRPTPHMSRGTGMPSCKALASTTRLAFNAILRPSSST